MLTLVVEGNYHEITIEPPQKFNYSYAFYCTRCGEVYARRIRPNGVWIANGGVCLCCLEKGPVHEFPYFRNPAEVQERWEPRAFLEEELRFALRHFELYGR